MQIFAFALASLLGFTAGSSSVHFRDAEPNGNGDRHVAPALLRGGVDTSTTTAVSAFVKTDAADAADATRWRDRSPIEKQLNIRFQTPEEIVAEFDETQGAYVTFVGLVSYRAMGETSIVDSFVSRYLDITFNEFEKYCATKCHKNRRCKAAYISKFDANLYEETGLHQNWQCDLLDPDVLTNGVPASQLSLLPSGFGEFRTLYVKKGSTIQMFDGCKVDYTLIEQSIGCLGCPLYGGDADTLPQGFCDHVCPTLVGAPGNSAQPDFWEKIVPAVQCTGARIAECLTCVMDKLEDGVELEQIPGLVCSEVDEHNVFRGPCNAECYTGLQHCEESLQTATLCVTGSAPGINAEAGVIVNGAVNAPYACPQED